MKNSKLIVLCLVVMSVVVAIFNSSYGAENSSAIAESTFLENPVGASEDCPMPLDIPSGICADGGSILCIEFDCAFDESVTIGMFSQSGNTNLSSVTQDGATVCFSFTIFVFDPCFITNETMTLEYTCVTGEAISIPFDFTIYPNPVNFLPSFNSFDPCDNTTIFSPLCGQLVSSEILSEGGGDCDNPILGELRWEVDPGFDISNAPACFVTQGVSTFYPCLDNCPCDVDVCGGVCIDLEVNLLNGPNIAICQGSNVDLELEYIGDGVDLGIYSIDFQLDGSRIGGTTNSPIMDAAETLSFRPDFLFSCMPLTQELTYVISCRSSFKEISTGTLGFVTIYPDPSRFEPIIIPGSCGIPIRVFENECGTLIFDEDLITLNCGPSSTDQTYTWEVDYGFEYDAGLDCGQILSGEITQERCTNPPGSFCGDFCIGEGTLSAECECIIENATEVTYLGPSEIKICGSGFTLEFEILNPQPDLIIEITDNYQIFEYWFGIQTSYELGIAPIFTESCPPISTMLYANFSCGGTIFDIIPLGDLTIYPNLTSDFVYTVGGAACGEVPAIELSDPCLGEINITNIVPPDNSATNPVDGYVEWEVDFSFDITDLPIECYDTSLFSGTAPITSCANEVMCEANNGTMSIQKQE